MTLDLNTRDAIDAHLRARETEVTKRDTEDLAHRIEILGSRLWWILGLSALTVTLLVSTYGALAIFVWRLVDKLTSPP